MAITDKISRLVQNQFPDFYKDEGENFLAFIQAYYEYMEQEGKLTHEIKNLESYRDISTTTDDYIDYFFNTLLPSVPVDVIADKKLMAKYIKEFNSSRGTLASYKLMFRTIFNEDVELYYPADSILKVSGGDWRIDRYLVTSYDTNTYKFIGKTIKGTESAAEALVEDVVTRVVRDRNLMQILLSNIKGTFNHLEPVRLLTDIGGTGHAPIVEAGINRVAIETAGGEYQPGDVVSLISSDIGEFGKIVVTNTIDLGGALTFLLVDGGSGYGWSTDETIWGDTDIEIIGGDGSDPASFTIERTDLRDMFALSMNVNLISSNNIYGALGPSIVHANGTPITASTFADTIIGQASLGFPEKGENVGNMKYRDHEQAWITIANTSNPGISVTDSLFGVTSGANATVTGVIRSYANNNVVLRVDGYRNFTTSEKVNIGTSTGTTVGTVSKFQGNTIGKVALSIGTIAGRTLNVGDVIAGRNSNTTGVVVHAPLVSNGHYNSTLVVANTVNPTVNAGAILNGETSGANAVIHYIDTDFASGTVTYNVRNFAAAFTPGEKVNLINYAPIGGSWAVANNTTIGTVSSFSEGGREIFTYRVAAKHTGANVSSQFDTGPIGRFIRDEGIYVVSSNTTVGNAAFTAANTVYENVYTLLRDSLTFAATYFGSIGRLSNVLGGGGYSIAPTVRVRNNDVVALGVGEAYLTLQYDDRNWNTGNSQITKLDTNDRIVQANTGASGDVKGGFGTSIVSLVTHANTTNEMVVRVWQDFQQREPGNVNWANNQYVDLVFYGSSYTPGTLDTRTPTDYGTAKIVSINDRGVLGKNAVITTGVGSNGTITGLRVVDSGFSYKHGEEVTIQSTGRPLAASGTATIRLRGAANAEGYYATSRSHVSSRRGFIQDSRYYQEFSYELLSPISLTRYRDIALKLCHPAGQALFGKYRAVSNAAMTVTANTSKTFMAHSNGTFSLTKPKASGTIAITSANTLNIVGTSTAFDDQFANGDVIIIETDPGDGLKNLFWQMQLNVVSSATSANLSEQCRWLYGNISGANVYYANTGTAHTLTGSSSTLTSEFADGDELLIEIDHKQYQRIVLNSVNSATSANLVSLWLQPDFSGANAYYITGSF